MALLAPNIYILEYLRNTQQLTPAIREKATNFLTSGESPFTLVAKRTRMPKSTVCYILALVAQNIIIGVHNRLIVLVIHIRLQIRGTLLASGLWCLQQAPNF